MMNQADINRKAAIREIVESPLFNEIFDSILLELTNEMIKEDDSTRRDSIYYETKAVDKFKGRLIAMANEIRMLKPRETTEDV